MNENGRTPCTVQDRCAILVRRMCAFVSCTKAETYGYGLIAIEVIWMLLTEAKSVRSIRTRCARSLRVQDPKGGTQNALVYTEFEIIYLSCKSLLETQDEDEDEFQISNAVSSKTEERERDRFVGTRSDDDEQESVDDDELSLADRL